MAPIIQANTNNVNAQSPASPISAEPQRQNLNTSFDRTASSETDPSFAAIEGKRGILDAESSGRQNQDTDQQQNSGLAAEDEIVGGKGAEDKTLETPDTPDMIDEPVQEKLQTRAAQPEDYNSNDIAAEPVKNEAPAVTETAKAAFWNVLSIFGVGAEKPTEEAQAKTPEEVAEEVPSTDVTESESEAVVDEEPNLKETESENPVAATNDYLIATSNTTNPHHAPATATADELTPTWTATESQAAPVAGTIDEYTSPTPTTESHYAADTTNELTPASTTESQHAADTTNELTPASTTEALHAADTTNELNLASTTESPHVADTTNELISTSTTESKPAPAANTGDDVIPIGDEPAHPVDNNEDLHQHGAYHDPAVTEPIRRQEKLQGLIDTVVGKLEKVVGARKKANVRLERGKERLEEAKHIKETGEVSAAMVRDVAISGKVADATRKKELGKEDTVSKDKKDKSLGLGLTLPEEENEASEDKESEGKAPAEDAKTPALSDGAGNLNQDKTSTLPQDKPSVQDASVKIPQESSSVNQA
ncbi:hypothetical protein BC937DRAFT_89370 [Endogone sp. FLAS-F59071]|nr:hypothetical protein BC937DRAFT_89370 [Endogone sp. FLAS-F59071]|eukprot:RUS17896.1 hypothetical protein BC937DRAFT_89370 [Endogone sp. FLAS-F59071]